MLRYRLPTALMVVVQDHATAAWAQLPVASGPPGLPTLTISPLVAGPHNMPVITDPAEAEEDLVLATLAAITHAGDPAIGDILKALSTALHEKPEVVADPIIELIAQGLGNRPAKELWRNLVAVDLSFYKSSISEEIRAEARVQTAAEDILIVLEARGLDVPDETRDRVTDCDDLDLLCHWLTRAVTVASAEEIFADGNA
ncbi:hypothetical protein SAMN05444521_3111 [Streptomyces sp. 3214.6]|nr:hypothetical protein SAMN05444521_3111 [Streptomyces sp. 3214.6]